MEDKLTQADLDAIHAFVATGFFTSHGDLIALVGKLLAAYEDRE